MGRRQEVSGRPKGGEVKWRMTDVWISYQRCQAIQRVSHSQHIPCGTSDRPMVQTPVRHHSQCCLPGGTPVTVKHVNT